MTTTIIDPKTPRRTSQLLVSLLIATVGAALLTAALLFTDATRPSSLPGFLAAYVLGAVAVASFGLLLGTVLPTSRAAQTVGLLLWFMFMFLSGAGPPPEVLPTTLRTIGGWLPLTPVVELLQEPWLSGQWAISQSLIAVAITIGSIAVAWRAYRWQ